MTKCFIWTLGLLSACNVEDEPDLAAVTQPLTQVDDLQLRELQWGPMGTGGYIAIGQTLDSWAPTGLQTTSVITFSAADNSGTPISGIDSTGIDVGDVRIFCNIDAPSDDGGAVFLNESDRSPPKDRIVVPGANSFHHNVPGSNHPDRYKQSSGGCTQMVYMQADLQNPDNTRWVIIGESEHEYRKVVQSLQLFPDNTPTCITGTVHNYAPVDVCQHVGDGYMPGYLCEDGASTSSDDYTVYNLCTTDATGATITGFQYHDQSWQSHYGPLKLVVNRGPGRIVIKNIGAYGSEPQNQVQIANSGVPNSDLTLDVGDSLLMWHGSHNNYWQPVGQFPIASPLTMNKVAKATGPRTFGDSSMSDDGVTWSLGTSKVTMNVASGDFATAGRANIAGTMTIGGNVAQTTVGNAFWFTTAQNTSLNVNASGNGAVRINSNTGGLANSGTGGLELYAGGNSATRAVFRLGNPSVNRGTLGAGSTDLAGDVSGANATNVTLTFSPLSYFNRVRCVAQPKTPQMMTVNGTGAYQTFACFDGLGNAAVCGAFTYICIGQ